MRQTASVHVPRAISSGFCRRVSALALTLLLVGTGGASAAPLAASETPARTLPQDIVPVHYRIELAPDLESSTVAGRAFIDVEVREPTARIVLNALDLTLNAARVESFEDAASIATDAAAQTATLTFAQPLAAGPQRLHVSFAARVSEFPRGLFTIKYGNAAGAQRMLASRADLAGARRIFPCWDEPAFKATFALTVLLPRAYLAISNMPIAHEEPVTPSLKIVSFARTPPIPTYAFALVAGELDRLTIYSDGVALSTVTVKGKREQARFALTTAAELLRYFNDYFGFRYPLPKLDLIALPPATEGATESWGAIAASETDLLFHRGRDSSSERRGVFCFLAKAIARQWVGDLVTVAAAEDMWLRQGVAGWIGNVAAERLHPRWPVESYLHAAKEGAMQSDARATSRPLRYPPASDNEDQSAHDKGQALIRMLARYIGADAFRAGIRTYVARHAYAAATPADLWQALEDASGRPVSNIARSFTEQAGVPLITVQTQCVGDTQRVRLREGRYTVHQPNAPAQSWFIPVAMERAHARHSPELFLLHDEKEILFGACGEPIKLNVGDWGYYRAEYEGASASRLTKSLALFDTADRLNALDDLWALVEASRADVSVYLALATEMLADDDPAASDQVIRTFARLNGLARGRPERAELQRYVRATLGPMLDRLGWCPSAREDEAARAIRTQLIRALGEFNDPQAAIEARRLFTTLTDEGFDPALRDAVTYVVGLHADRATYDSLLALARGSGDARIQLRYYLAAGSAGDPALARATLELILADEFPDWIKPKLLNAVAWAGEQPELVWEFLQKNFAALAARLGPSFAQHFVPNFMRHFSDPDHAQALVAFTRAHASAAAHEAAKAAYDAIMADAELKERPAAFRTGVDQPNPLAALRNRQTCAASRRPSAP
jgi:aminopeptidase N